MPTVNDLTTRLIDVIAPGDTQRFLRLLQEADDRLLEFGRWNWTREKITLVPVDNGTHYEISLPPGYLSILAARFNSAAKDIQAEEFEFAPGGPGDVPIVGGDNRLIDNGFQTKLFNSTMQTRHVYKVTGDVNVAEDTIVALVRLDRADLSSEVADASSSGGPGTSPSTRCPDFAALKLAMLAIIFEEENDIERSNQYMATALRGLDSKEKSYRAGAKQAFPARPFGSGITGIRSLR